MNRSVRTAVPGLLAFLLVTATVAYAQETDTVSVMFAFDDGTVLWAQVPLEDNRTAIRVTERAAESLGLELEVSWYTFGALVEDIGDRNPEFPYWWHLLVWNSTKAEWDLSPVGASDLTLGAGDVIGWFLTADDPNWDFVSPWPGPKPLADPVHPYPVTAFRGDLVNSGWTQVGAPERAGIRWSFDTGGSEISATAVGGRGVVYQVTWNGTYALSLANGTVLWRVEEAAGLSTPAILEGDLIVGSRDGRLYRIDGETGQVVWSALLQPGPTFTGIASSPKVSRGRVIVGTFNETGGPGRLVSVYTENGSVAWSIQTGSIHMSSPAVSNGVIYVGVMGMFNATSLAWDLPYGLVSVYEANGTERWFFPTDGPVASSPLVVGDIIYFTSRDGNLYAVGEEGSLRFKVEVGPSTSSPATDGESIYVASGVLGTGGMVLALGKDGQEIWSYEPNGPVQSSLTVAGDLLLFATNSAEGTVYALWARNGTLAWSFTPQPSQFILSTPVVIDGIVVVASDNGFVYALDQAAETGADFIAQLTPVILAAVAAATILAILFVLTRRRRA